MGTASPPARDAPEETGAPHLRLGREGEDLAARHLEGLGFVILSRNWRCREGELDLVVTDGSLLVVCEVKTRSGTDFGDPAEAVTDEKIARIRRITGQWLRVARIGWCRLRFDVISISRVPGEPARLRHFPGAF
jgi:putative endonuclease